MQTRNDELPPQLDRPERPPPLDGPHADDTTALDDGALVRDPTVRPSFLQGNLGSPHSGASLAGYGDPTLGAALSRMPAFVSVPGFGLHVGGWPVGELLINDLRVASPRFLPAASFPLAILATPNGLTEGASVYRSYLAFLPGTLGGGIVSLSTRRPRATQQARALGALGVRRGATFEGEAGYEGGRSQAIIVRDDGTRDLPEAARALRDASVPNGEVFDNNWDAHEETLLPDSALAIVAGGPVPGTEDQLRYTAALTHRQGNTAGTEISNVLVALPIGLVVERRDSTRFRQSHADLAGHAAAEYVTAAKHRFVIEGLWWRSMRDATASTQTSATFEPQDSLATDLVFRQRELLALQGRADFSLSGTMRLSVRYGLARGTYDEPDGRSQVWSAMDGAPEARWRGALRSFYRDGETTHDLGAELLTETDLSSTWSVSARLGLSYLGRVRSGELLRFDLNASRRVRQPVATMDRNATPFGPSLEALIDDPDSSLMTGAELINRFRDVQTNAAAHADLALSAGETLSMRAGVRLASVGRRAVNQLWGVRHDTGDTALQPTAVVTWQARNDLSLRASASHTRRQPLLSELAPSATDPTANLVGLVVDTPLRPSSVWHARVGGELDGGAGHIGMAGFAQVIERLAYPTLFPAGDGVTATYGQARAGRVLGLEVSGGTRLAWLTGWARHLGLTGQVALIDASIGRPPEIRGEELSTTPDAPEPFTSPGVLAGAQLLYHHAGLHVGIGYLYQGAAELSANLAATRLAQTTPAHQLDATLTLSVSDRVTLGLALRNVLNTPSERRVQGQRQYFRRVGQRIALGATVQL